MQDRSAVASITWNGTVYNAYTNLLGSFSTSYSLSWAQLNATPIPSSTESFFSFASTGDVSDTNSVSITIWLLLDATVPFSEPGHFCCTPFRLTCLLFRKQKWTWSKRPTNNCKRIKLHSPSQSLPISVNSNLRSSRPTEVSPPRLPCFQRLS